MHSHSSLVPAFSCLYFVKVYNIYFMGGLHWPGLRCRTRAFSSCSEQGLSSLWSTGCSVWGCLSLQSTGSRHMHLHQWGLSSCGSWALEQGFSSCGAWTLFVCSMWNIPGPEIETVSSALAGGFLSAVPPRKFIIF